MILGLVVLAPILLLILLFSRQKKATGIALDEDQLSGKGKKQSQLVTTTTTSKAAHINYQKLGEIGLSKREYEVLKLIAEEDLSNKEIADRLGISEHTAKAHVSAILQKMGVQKRSEAIKLAKEWSLL